MAWGSNVTEVQFNTPVTQFDPALWLSIGKGKRDERKKTDATLAVANARKEAKERYLSGRDGGKSQIEAKLRKAEQELKQIDDEIAKLSQSQSAEPDYQEMPIFPMKGNR